MTPSSSISLLFVNQYYHPDVAATGQHLKDLAEFLAARGYSVTVFASRAPYDSGGTTASKRERKNGVTIRRFRSTEFGRSTNVGRIADYLSFYIQVLCAVVFGRRYDGIIFLTTPPLIPVIGFVARAIRGQRYAIWSMDLHPAAEIAAGMIRDESLTGRCLHALWRVAHTRAEIVIALGVHMRDRIVTDGVSPDRLSIVPPWSPRLNVHTTSGANPIRRMLQLESRFVVMYSGNAGIVHDFDAILEAMSILKDDGRVFFLFVGSGPRRADIEAFARAERLRNFAYHDYFEREDVASSLAVADVHLVCLRSVFAGISVPSKLYGIMAAQRPALFVGPIACESADTILQAECGAVVNSADHCAGARVAETLLRWHGDPDERARLGRNAEQAFLREHDMSTNCGRIARLLESRWSLVNREPW